MTTTTASADTPPADEAVKRVAESLTPLEAAYLLEMCKRGWTRTGEGGMADTILSGLCSKPSPDNSLCRWEMNQDDRRMEWPNKYLPTPLGLAVRSYLERSTNG